MYYIKTCSIQQSAQQGTPQCTALNLTFHLQLLDYQTLISMSSSSSVPKCLQLTTRNIVYYCLKHLLLNNVFSVMCYSASIIYNTKLMQNGM